MNGGKDASHDRTTSSGDGLHGVRSDSECTPPCLQPESRADSVLKDAIDVVMKARLYKETYSVS